LYHLHPLCTHRTSRYSEIELTQIWTPNSDYVQLTDTFEGVVLYYICRVMKRFTFKLGFLAKTLEWGLKRWLVKNSWKFFRTVKVGLGKVKG
jgi:hypothetical protein